MADFQGPAKGIKDFGVQNWILILSLRCILSGLGKVTVQGIDFLICRVMVFLIMLTHRGTEKGREILFGLVWE